MFDNSPDSDILIRNTFKNALDHLQYDCETSDSSTCDQCGNWNCYEKYSK